MPPAPTHPPDWRRFRARTEPFALFGARIRLTEPGGSSREARPRRFQLRETLDILGNAGQALQVVASSVFGTRGAFDVLDAGGARIGTCSREGWALRSTWSLGDSSDYPIATVREDRLGLALLRRLFFANWLPRTFTVATAEGRTLGRIRQRFHLFARIVDVDLEDASRLDPRLAIAATVLVLAVDGT